MRSVVIEQPFWVNCWPELFLLAGPRVDRRGHVDFGELCVEPSVLDTSSHRAMIRVGIFWKCGENHLSLPSADHPGERMAVLDRVFDEPIW